MTSITTNILKNVLVMFLSDPRVYQFYLIQVNKISVVEMGKMLNTLSGVQEKLRSSKLFCNEIRAKMARFFCKA